MNTVSNPESQPVYSVVAPVYNESQSLPEFYNRVCTALDSLGEPWELVLVNDGSRDTSLEVMRQLNASDSRIKLIDFARNFGHQIAVTAGQCFTTGQGGISIDFDVPRPPGTICDLLKEGAECLT